MLLQESLKNRVRKNRSLGYGICFRTAQKILAFVKRDFSILVSYRLSFFFQFFGIFFSLLTFFFIAKLFGQAATQYLESYGGDYFSFVLIGITFSDYLRFGLGSFAEAIREGQMLGTLEAMLATPTRIHSIVLFSSAWRFLFSSLRVASYILLGVFVFDVPIVRFDVGAVILVLLLTIVAFSSLGIISASFIMVFKRGNPLTWLFGSFSTLFGGVFFPVNILPPWLQGVSYFIPITYSLRALRYALLQGYSFKALSSDILLLAIFSAVLLPLGIYAFGLAVRKAKRDGTLTHY